jgi:hypothetical protein
VGGGGEDGHIDAELGDELLRGDRPDTADLIELGDLVGERSDHLVDLRAGIGALIKDRGRSALAVALVETRTARPATDAGMAIFRHAGGRWMSDENADHSSSWPTAPQIRSPSRHVYVGRPHEPVPVMVSTRDRRVRIHFRLLRRN